MGTHYHGNRYVLDMGLESVRGNPIVRDTANMIENRRTSGSSVFLTRGTPLAGQESRRGSESAEP